MLTVLFVSTYFNITNQPQLKNLSPPQNFNILSEPNAFGVLRYGLGLNKRVGTYSHCLGSKICPYRLIFCQQTEEVFLTPNFLEEIILVTRIWSKIIFRVLPLRWMANLLKINFLLILNCPNSDFSFSVWVWISKALKITVLIVKSGHVDSYFAHR